jgi:hypothetical protein
MGSHQQHYRRTNFIVLTTSLFVLSAAVMVVLPTSSEAFVNTACPTARPSALHYSPMPDVADMRAAEMKTELESYGINTKTMFDKRDFEEALLNARRDYEQTLKDCMSNTPFSGSKKKSSSTVDNGIHDTSTDSFTNAASREKKKTVNYDRTNPSHFHERERMWDMGSRNGPDPIDSFETDPRSHYHPRDPYAAGFSGRRRSVGVETDPLFAHEAQYAYGGRGRPGRGPPPPPPHAHDYAPPHTGRRVYNGAPPPPPPPPPRNGHRRTEPQYNDPATQMKYHEALQTSYTMKVEDLQKELNERGISTKYCFTLADFCVEYAKATAEGKEKKAAATVEDEDYDPSYRDVVMEPYDPNKFF